MEDLNTNPTEPIKVTPPASTSEKKGEMPVTEKPAAPAPKTRLIFSVIVFIAGFVALYGVEPFDSQTYVGWGLVVLGLASILYNVNCIRKGKYM